MTKPTTEMTKEELQQEIERIYVERENGCCGDPAHEGHQTRLRELKVRLAQVNATA